MSIPDKVFEALRSSILLHERVKVLDDKVRQMGQDIRNLNDRMIRMETIFEMAQGHVQLPQQTSPKKIKS